MNPVATLAMSLAYDSLPVLQVPSGVDVLDLPKILSYGAIGLGCILAVLAYLLLRREQDQHTPRHQIVRSIYVFLAFSLLLAGFGFFSELYRDKTARLAEQRIAQLESTIQKSRETLFLLLGQKGGRLRRLTEYDPASPEFPKIIADIQGDLKSLDSAMQSVLDNKQ